MVRLVEGNKLKTSITASITHSGQMQRGVAQHTTQGADDGAGYCCHPTSLILTGEWGLDKAKKSRIARF